MNHRYENPRIKSSKLCNAEHGAVHWSPEKSVWYSSMLAVLLIVGPQTISLETISLFLIFSAFTLCFGHSLGMHRLFIHKSYTCPKWLEYALVHLGVLVGLAGPFAMLQTHDMKDWAQRQNKCHDYFGHQQPMLKDGFWQIHCDIRLKHPPKILIETDYYEDPVYRWMEKYWMWQQLPWAILFFILGGIPWVVWGICARVTISITGHWLIGHFAHNKGQRHYHINNAAIQGYNIPLAALITMGESLHNNHHAFPTSAKLSIARNEWDPGWWMLSLMERIGLAKNIKLPDPLAKRSDLSKITLTVESTN